MGTTSAKQRVGIIGAGKIGRPIGRHLATAGHQVIFGSRTPASLDSFMARLGGSALAAAQIDAVRASDVVLLAVPHPALDELLGTVGPDLADKVVIDATNPMGLADDGRIVSTLNPGVTQGRHTATALPGSSVVRAFNHVMDELLWSRGTHQKHFWGMAIAGDNPAAKEVVSGLVYDTGFTPVDLGGLDDSASLDPGGALFPHMFTPVDMHLAAGLKALCGPALDLMEEPN